eukprot:CAMPEP_0114356720 /NCGR_PEP_ID=MMETSP0101-20121206/21151_1 /TAXON_ID=38822 ORGANISM="Pteridomonas danica, Strain PT" /NCGR_SAMPLE_ID=MMETSP0101 /ASSEMBLY_ACC=CAM_ASM_000211 /LENGTH=394 /DNA_ID=CAMNT_0001499249 /DNA_START=121 /DNA_END=1305 /DNA_ORIENTATION=+
MATEMMPAQVSILQERMKGAQSSLNKFINRRDEVDSVTDKSFLEKIARYTEAFESASRKVVEFHDKQMRASQVLNGASDSTETIDKIQAQPTEEEGVEEGRRLQELEVTAAKELAELEATRTQHVVEVKRYGAAMCSRIANLEEVQGQILVEFPKVIEQSERRAHEAQVALELIEKQKAEEAKVIEEKTRAEAEAVRVQQEAQEEIRKQQEEYEQKLKREKLESEKDALETRQNAEQFATEWPKGERGVVEAVDLLRTRANEDELKVALSGLAAILEALISHPDDESRRTINTQNEKFQLDIARFGTEVLFAAGFKLKHTRCEGEYEDNGLAKFATRLVLREPDPFSDIDQWTIWFDNLKACSVTASRLASEVGAKAMKPLEAPPTWANKGKAY